LTQTPNLPEMVDFTRFYGTGSEVLVPVATGMVLVSQSSRSYDWSKHAAAGLGSGGKEPHFLFSSPEFSCLTSPSLTKRAATALRRAKNRRMSQDHRVIADFPHGLDSSRYDNSFNTIGSLNNNSNSLNNNTNCFNTNTNCGNVSNITVTDDRSEILTWLSPLEPRLRHYDIQTRRVDNVGDWLLRTEQFRSWYGGDGGQGESQKAIMFCSGNPGVGKTYIR